MKAEIRTHFPRAPSETAPFDLRGRGLHTGRDFSIRLEKPRANALSPIEFFTQFDGKEFHSPALWTRISGTTRATALVLRGDDKRRLEMKTVEHFLAAAQILSVHAGVRVQPEGAEAESVELPLLDGSSAQWFAFLSAHQEKSFLSKSVWVCVRPVEVTDGLKRVLILPHEQPDDTRSVFHCDVDFGGPWKQDAYYEMDWLRPEAGRRDFEKNIAPARTFGFVHELEALKARGLASGASFDNAILLDNERVHNPGGFQVPSELAAHKLLDGIGDLALLGGPLLGRVELTQAGHSMHTRALEEGIRQGAFVKARLKFSGELLRG